ncbi:MAG TPA: hypothetical protein VFM14_07815, partial [Gemmatimonadales bacterium]|nr:hypothetical protein [Gemmatimonadales bacterium]
MPMLSSAAGAALIVLAGAGPDDPAETGGSRGALTKGTFAITDVAVIPMTRDTVLAASTVVVRDGRIAAIGPSRTVKVPSGARRIDGRGKYL